MRAHPALALTPHLGDAAPQHAPHAYAHTSVGARAGGTQGNEHGGAHWRRV